MIDIDITLPRKHFDIVLREKFHRGITGIFGPSGSGKTSLLQVISGLSIPTSGRIAINRRKVFDTHCGLNVPTAKRNIGYVFQEGRLFPHMTVEKNLRYGIKKSNQRVDFDEVVQMLDLGRILKSRPASISGGEKQRTALGRTLLTSPDALLLDEPFSALDTRLRDQILPFLLKVQQRFDVPVLVVSHDLPDLLKLTHSLCLLHEGRCIGHGAYHQLLKSSTSAAVLGQTPVLNVIDMQVETEEGPDTGLVRLVFHREDGTVTVKCEKTEMFRFPGKTVRIFLNADDIALSAQKPAEMTIQNQIEGTVVDVIDRGAKMLCIVDVGFRLLVEITAASQAKMNIVPGRRMWCLFKAVAIQTCETAV